MKYSFFKPLNVLLALLGLGLAGCTSDMDYVTPDTGESDTAVTITVSIPGMETPRTRSIAGAGGEATISTVDILVFDNSSPAKLIQHATGQVVSQSTDGNEKYQVQFRASLTADADARSVVIVANAADVVRYAVQYAGANPGKQDLLADLQYASANSLGTADGWKWNTNAGNVSDPEAGTDYAAVPMYGEKAVSGITAGMKIENIDMTRMLARIDVVNSASGFTLTDVYMVNYNTKGYIAPAWNTTDGALLSALPATPMIPSNANTKTGQSNAMHYNYATLATASGMLGEVYTYEAAATTGAEGTSAHTNAACLILKGTYNGTPYYYRVDFTDGTDSANKTPGQSGFNPVTVNYLPLYRNHCYTITVDAVKGIGYDSFGEALGSLGILNNLQTTLHVIDESGVKDIVYNGQHYLGVETISVGYGGGVQEAKVITNYSGGWEIDTTQGTGGIEYETGETREWVISVANVSGKLQVVADLNAWDGREVTIYLKAGRLRHQVTVTQSECMAEDVPESNCYMIDNADPQPIYIPVSHILKAMGSGASGGGYLGSDWITAADYGNLRACLLWSDTNHFGFSDKEAVVRGAVFKGTNLQDGKILVVPGTGAGNAVIALYEEHNGAEGYHPEAGDVIRWSWHIWNSDYYPYDYKGDPLASGTNNRWMARNLGATASEPASASDNLETHGLVYQWGRKDPQPGANFTYRGMMTVDKEYTKEFYSPTENDPLILEQQQHYSEHNLDNSVMNPFVYYYSYDGTSYCDWFTNRKYYENNDLWGAVGTSGFLDADGKSVYDPCPVGYRVPGSPEWLGSPAVGSEYFANYGFYQENMGGYYPATGNRQLGSLAQDMELYGVGYTGYYWQANAQDYYGYISYFTINSQPYFINNRDNHPRAYGMSVRCVAIGR